MESPEGRRETIMRQIVRKFLLHAQIPANEWASKEAGLLRLSQHILNSSIKGNLEYDEGKLMDAIKKSIVTQDGDIEKAARMAQVLAAFQRNTDYRRKWAILQFLLRLSERSQLLNPNLGHRSIFEINPVTGVSKAKGVSTNESIPELIIPTTNAEAWRDFQAARSSMKQRERVILSDLIAVLQGHDGNCIKFNSNLRCFQLQNNGSLIWEPSLKCAVEQLSSIGACYKQLSEDSTFMKGSSGLVSQGFKVGLEAEMRDYLKIVTLFESLVSEGSENRMTLKRAIVWFSESKIQLNLLVKLSSIAKVKTGPELLDAIAVYLKHGCQSIKETAERILDCMSKPYLACITEWITRGYLVDPYQELFIGKRDSRDDGNWSKSFVYRPDQLPKSLINEELAMKIFNTGKTLNFLSRCDPEEDDVDDEMEVSTSGVESHFVNDGTLKSIEAGLKDLYGGACKKLGKLLFGRFALVTHLCNLRDYLLLGRSDFSDALLEGLYDTLNRPAQSIFRHSLVGALDGAVRATVSDNHVNLSILLQNLDVRLHEASGAQKLGWDIFSLDYRIPNLLESVIDAASMKEYVRLSQFLWLERRIHYSIKTSWIRLRSHQRQIRLIPGTTIIKNGSSHTPCLDLWADYKRLQMLHQEAIHTTSQLIQFSSSCIKTAWSAFEKSLLDNSYDADLDFYATLHAAYLANIRSQLLTCCHQGLRTKIMALFSTVLRIDRATQMFSAYISLLSEQQQLHQNDPSLLLKALTDLRGACHSAARQFHLDMDEIGTLLARESMAVAGSNEAPPLSKTTASNLILLLDFNGYHERRGGFDATKYKQF